MPYAILRFQKRKAGGVAACERHNEREEAYKSNPDIDMERSKNNYHLIVPPKYTYKKEINRMVAEAGCRTKAPVQMIISREYVGTQTVTEAFVPIISEDIRKKIAEGDTFDNEGLSA